MIYIIFFVSQFMTLGVGAWFAMSRLELSKKHHQNHQPLMNQGTVLASIPDIPEDETSIIDAADSVQPGNSETVQEKVAVVEDSVTKISDSVNSEYGDVTLNSIMPDVVDNTIREPMKGNTDRNESDRSWKKGTNPETDFMRTSERLHRDMSTPLPSGKMIEQLVSMIKEDSTGIPASIASQLQEIHNMVTSTDKHYFASENAEYFITQDEERYATTTICRPIVGRKRLS